MISKKNIKFFFTLLFINSLFSQTSFEVGYLEYKRNNYREAISLFDKSIASKQQLVKSYMFRGAANIFLNNLKDSKIDLDKSFELDSLNGNIYLYYGKYYLAIKEYKLALKSYNVAILKKSNLASAYGERSGAKCMLEDYYGAIEDADKAISIDSTQQVFYTNRGYAKIKLKDYEEAIKDFDFSLKIKPNQKDYANKGIAFSLLKMEYSAIENYTKALDFNPNDPEILYLRGYMYEILRMFTNACEDYFKSISIINNKSASEGLLRINCEK